MSASTDIANFVIIGAIPGTNPANHNLVFPPNSNEYTFIASAIGIALKMMETAEAQTAMTDLALTYDSLRGGNLLRNDRDTARRWIAWFVNTVKVGFPKTYVDEDTTNPDEIAAHFRKPWDGTWDTFVPREQNLMLNAQVCLQIIDTSAPRD
jgi:hypothetical protein